MRLKRKVAQPRIPYVVEAELSEEMVIGLCAVLGRVSINDMVKYSKVDEYVAREVEAFTMSLIEHRNTIQFDKERP